MPIPFKKNQTLLFQGDSITDAGRSRENDTDKGRGYAMMTAAWLGAMTPGLELCYINRGISGNRIGDLNNRVQEDFLDIKPDWVSLLIGINDTWKRYSQNDETPTADFEAGYRKLLDSLMAEVKPMLILCEPFLLPCPEDRLAWREDLDPKIDVVHRLAKEYSAILVPFDQAFKMVADTPRPEYWAEDGVHPTPAGHAFMTQTWLKAVFGEQEKSLPITIENPIKQAGFKTEYNFNAAYMQEREPDRKLELHFDAHTAV